jgi:serine/threonine-protein kinase RsbW
MSTPAGQFHRQFESSPAQLAPVRKELEAFATANGFNEVAVGEIGLCVNEALANIIRHSYHGETDQPILVDADMDGDTIRITLRDWGDGKAPLRLPPASSHDPNKPGGLGLICMGRLMDKVSFIPQVDGMMLEMRKRRK